ncbi:zinc finger, CCHC-type containing protein [Tanacetum coccineum]
MDREVKQLKQSRILIVKVRWNSKRGPEFTWECEDQIRAKYAEHSKAYRFYVIEPNDFVSINSIIESRDAIFDENRFSSIPRPKDIIPNSDESQRDDHLNDVPTETLEPRRGKRARKAKSYGFDFQLYLVEGSRDQIGSQYSYCYSIEDDPRTYIEAMQSRDAAFWKKAIDDEIGSIIENNTWVLSDLPIGCKPLGCKWIFKRKMKVDGTIDKFKARLVIQGFRQKEGIDYFDTYAPVARITTIRLLLALAAIHNLFSMKDMGEADIILGIKIKCENKGIVITQSHYIEKILKEFNREDCSLASKKQTYITGFTMEFEFVALSVVGKEAEWLRNLIHEIPIWPKPITSISIHYDSAATLAKAYSQIYNGESRHLGVRHSMIRELIMNGVISIKFVRSQHNLADHLMKGLAKDLVIKSVIGMF